MTKPLRIFLVDDEDPARSRLREVLSDCATDLPLVLVGEAHHGYEALEILQHTVVDVVLCDIRMPEMDGLELAHHLQHVDHVPLIIFTTAFDEYAVQAFELAAVDYLLKPVRQTRLLAALQRASTMLGARQALPIAPKRRYIAVTERGRMQLVPLDQVLYLKAELKYITIVTRDKSYLLEAALTQLEQEFPDRFVRIHRNCLVSSTELIGFEKGADPDGEMHWLAQLQNGERLPVSRRQWHLLRERFR